MPFKIFLAYGDEDIGRYQINIFAKSGKYFAENISERFFVGKQDDGTWTTELDIDKMRACLKFIQTARSLPRECPTLSSGVTEYVICLPGDTIRTENDCDWNGLNFFELRQLLFKDHFTALKIKRDALIESLNRRIEGKWSLDSQKSGYKRDDQLILKRQIENAHLCYWTFGKNFLFSSSCKIFAGFDKADVYEWDVDEGHIFLQIGPTVFNDKGGNSEIVSVTFELDTLETEKLRLKFLW